MGRGWLDGRVGVAAGLAILAATLCAGYRAGDPGAARAHSARPGRAGLTARLRAPRLGPADRAGAAAALPPPPRRYAVFVGVNSRPVTPRRDTLRATWFPGDRAALAALEAAGVYARFIIGHPPAEAGDAKAVEAGLAAEAAAHGDIFRVPALEAYEALPLKSMAYLRAALAAVDAQYYIKTDDDMYVRLDRLPAAVSQWAADGAGYVGCLNMDGPLEADPASVYYEPFRAMLPEHADGSHDGDRKWFGYMSGGFYGVARQAAEWVTLRPDSMMRLLSGEDSSLGLQMLSLPVRTVEDRRLCAAHCTQTSIVMTDAFNTDLPVRCAGKCKPDESLPRLHADPACTSGGDAAADIGPLWAPGNQRKLGRADTDAIGCSVLRGGRIDRSACRSQLSAEDAARAKKVADERTRE